VEPKFQAAVTVGSPQNIVSSSFDDEADVEKLSEDNCRSHLEVVDGIDSIDRVRAKRACAWCLSSGDGRASGVGRVVETQRLTCLEEGIGPAVDDRLTLRCVLLRARITRDGNRGRLDQCTRDRCVQ